MAESGGFASASSSTSLTQDQILALVGRTAELVLHGPEFPGGAPAARVAAQPPVAWRAGGRRGWRQFRKWSVGDRPGSGGISAVVALRE